MSYMEPNRDANALLIVEDDTVTREVFGLIISRQFPDLTVYTAEDGISGLEMFRRHRPQIVITDINMPGMDGIEMAAEIKTIKTDTTFIAVTAYDTANCIERATMIGFCRFLTKPVQFPELFAAVRECITGKA
jgi:YesN/AraC family two-component response regulator